MNILRPLCAEHPTSEVSTCQAVNMRPMASQCLGYLPDPADASRAITAAPKGVLGSVFLGGFGISEVIGKQFGVMDLENLRNVFQENKAENDVLVFRRFQIAARVVSL